MADLERLVVRRKVGKCRIPYVNEAAMKSLPLAGLALAMRLQAGSLSLRKP